MAVSNRFQCLFFLLDSSIFCLQHYSKMSRDLHTKIQTFRWTTIKYNSVKETQFASLASWIPQLSMEHRIIHHSTWGKKHHENSYEAPPTTNWISWWHQSQLFSFVNGATFSSWGLGFPKINQFSMDYCAVKPTKKMPGNLGHFVQGAVLPTLNLVYI